MVLVSPCARRSNLRQPIGWCSLCPIAECLQRARAIIDAVHNLPCSIAHLNQATWVGFGSHFARFSDVDGESLEGLGSRSAPYLEAAKLEEDQAKGPFPLLDALTDVCVPCSFDLDKDRSGALLWRQSVGADR